MKFKMAATRGRISRVTRPEINQYRKLYHSAKFRSFIPICGILLIFEAYSLDYKGYKGLDTLTRFSAAIHRSDRKSFVEGQPTEYLTKDLSRDTEIAAIFYGKSRQCVQALRRVRIRTM